MNRHSVAAHSLVLLLILAVIGCGRPAAPGAPSPSPSAAQPRATASPAGFDFYLLNLSWSPEFCQTHAGAAECAQHPAFVLHGLWPENSNGSYPQHCTNAPGPADPSQYADLYPDPGLLQHEWQTHGTCSGLAPDAYFALVRSAFHKVVLPPTLEHLAADTSFTPQQIVAQFTTSNPAVPAASLVVSCGNNYLTAVEACLDSQLQPVSCGAVRSCHANSVKVVAPR